MKGIIVILCLLPWISTGKKQPETRMVFHSDVQVDKIWLIMQKDISWPEGVQFKVSVIELPDGEERVVQEGVTWAELSEQYVTDGKLEGWNYAVLVDGLTPATTYRIMESITRPTGEVIPLDILTYMTKGDQSPDCSMMRVCPNGAGAWVPAATNRNVIKKRLAEQNRMFYQSDVQDSRIWLLMQRDVSWPEGITFEVIVKDTVTGLKKVVQEPVSWPELAQQYVTSGKLQGWPFAVLADNLTPGRTYLIEEVVRDVDGDVFWTQDTSFKTAGGGGRQRCVRMRVCPVGDGTYVPQRD